MLFNNFCNVKMGFGCLYRDFMESKKAKRAKIGAKMSKITKKAHYLALFASFWPHKASI